MATRLEAIGVATPTTVLTNEALAAKFPGWSAEKIEKKLGIASRHVLDEHETPSDIALIALERVFERTDVGKDEIDFLVYCTQSPDYVLPTTACILQHKAGLPLQMGAVDINQGCSGYIYGLAHAHSLIAAGIARKVLVVTADAYSRLLDDNDASVRTIFGDAATASLVVDSGNSASRVGAFAFGTDGSGMDALIVRNSGMRLEGDGARAKLHMDGPGVLNFTLREIPPFILRSLESAALTLDEIDFFVFHQANLFILSQLQRKLKIPDEKMIMDFADVGNTVSSTIPIAIARQIENGRLKRGQTGFLIGFGVGLSWASCVITL